MLLPPASAQAKEQRVKPHVPGQITLTTNDCLDATFSQMQLEHNIKYLLQSADIWIDVLWNAS